MEDTTQEQTTEVEEPTLTPEETPTPEEPEAPTTPPVEEDVAEEEAPKEKDIDYAKKLADVQKTQPRSELEKASYTLKKTAERLTEIGGDPAEVLNIKPPTPEPQDTPDVQSVVKREFAERDARAISRNDDEYALIMWYVDNKGLSVQEAHLLANKERFQRNVTEARRANPSVATPSAGTKVATSAIPMPSQERIALAEGRGLKFNPKTREFVGKHSREYWDPNEKTWKSQLLVNG